MQYNFEWDPDKARANARKHGVSFEQAAMVFSDPMALTIFDADASIGEDRWVTLGKVNGHHCLVVAHSYRDEDDHKATIRLISARPATSREIKQYEG